jgi:hypothetical protein
MAAVTYIKDSIDLEKLEVSESAIAEYEKLRLTATVESHHASNVSLNSTQTTKM